MSLIIDGGILAGGLATRMGGVDKGLQLYQDRPMVEHVYDALSPFVRQVIINCNRNQDDYEFVSPHLCADGVKGFKGPLAGILSIIDSSDADYFLISPCDTPLIGTEYAASMVAELNHQLENEDKPLLMAAKDESNHHPLHLLISRQFRESIADAIHQGNHKVMRWMFDHGARWLEFNENDVFVNFNTLEELTLANQHSGI